MNSDYSIKRSKRARQTRITVKYTGDVVVTMPYHGSLYRTVQFIKLKYPWIKETQEKVRKKFEGKQILKQSKREYSDEKQRALHFVLERLRHFNTVYNFKIGGIRIKNHSSRWGSCSAKGNLNFNYKIVSLPKELADYIIVHELCHLKEFNHSKKFWDLMAVTLPNWRDLRQRLKSDYITIQ